MDVNLVRDEVVLKPKWFQILQDWRFLFNQGRQYYCTDQTDCELLLHDCLMFKPGVPTRFMILKPRDLALFSV